MFFDDYASNKSSNQIQLQPTEISNTVFSLEYWERYKISNISQRLNIIVLSSCCWRSSCSLKYQVNERVVQILFRFCQKWFYTHFLHRKYGRTFHLFRYSVLSRTLPLRFFRVTCQRTLTLGSCRSMGQSFEYGIS